MMGTDEEQSRLHNAAEGLETSIALAQAAAWWTVAEIMRRHPDDVRLFETIPIEGGGYVCLAIYRSRDGETPYVGTVVHLNLAHSSYHIASHGENPIFLNWAEVVLAPNRRSYVVEPIERVLDLRTPQQTPPTRRSTVGYRVIAAFMARAAFAGGTAITESNGLGDAHWHVTQGFFEGEFQNKFYDAFGSMPNPPQTPMNEHGYPAWEENRVELPIWYADHWFLLERGEPKAAIDVRNGRAWNQEGEHDLMAMFEKLGRSIDRVTSAVMPPTG